MSGGGGGSQNTVTSTTQIPLYEQQFSQQIQGQAGSLATQAAPVYQGQLVAGFTPQQQTAFGAINNAYDAQTPYNTQARGDLSNAQTNLGAAGSYETSAVPYQQQDAAMQQQGANEYAYANTLNPTNSAALDAYMSPYVGLSLQPQMLSAEQNLASQQLQNNASATQANAFGDARQGVQGALNNYYGDQTMSGIQASGYNSAYNDALSSLNQEQQNAMGIASGEGQLGNNTGQAGMNVATIGNNIANQAMDMGTLGTDQATLGQMVQGEQLAGANALYDSGQIQQNQQQQALNMEYQQYMNQVQWPYQMLNVEESALSNSPYNISNMVTLPQANQTATNLGAFSSLAGLLGGSAGGGNAAANGGANVFGGA